MLIGAMNHPEKEVLDEIAWMGDMGIDFIDLTLEPPGAASWEVDVKAIRAKLDACHMGVVGHTAWYLPMASAIEDIRCGAVDELKRCLERFGEIGRQMDEFASGSPHTLALSRLLYRAEPGHYPRTDSARTKMRGWPDDRKSTG